MAEKSLFSVKILSPLKATADDLARRQQRYAAHAGPHTRVQVDNLEGGPAALNSSGDVLASAAAIYSQALATASDEWQAILIDCVFDPAVDEIREATGIPTFGPTRTTLPLIPLIAANFSIIARTRRQCELLAHLVENEGYGNFLHSMHALDIPYEEAKQPHIFSRVMVDRLHNAVGGDGAGAILLGSTTMAIDDDMRAAASGVPLFMPGMVALGVMEQLWAGGLWPGKSTPRAAFVVGGETT
jgi:Asp/Glu/hydantoin racemase